MKKLKHIKLFELSSDDFYKGEKTKVRITKCDNPMFWYKNHINQEFFVVKDDSNTKWKDGKEKWKVVPDSHTSMVVASGVNYINKEDCILI